MRPSDFLIPALVHNQQRATQRLSAVNGALLAARQGAIYEAVQLLDLCCRASAPSADDFLLRAELLNKMGFSDLAVCDLEHAYEIDPTQHAISSRYLASLSESGRSDDARKVADIGIRLGTDLQVHTTACRWLVRQDKADGIVLLRSSALSVTVIVMAKNYQAVDLELQFDRSRMHLLCEMSASHSLASVLGLAAIIEIPWQEGSRTVSIRGGEAFVWPTRQAYRPFFTPVPPAGPADYGRGTRPSASALTVVVPVFAGYDETVACLESLFAQTSSQPRRIVIIDDCGPEPILREYLLSLRGRQGVHILLNPFNLGFIGSVNRALSLHPEGDVLLLNADVVLPPQALDRLRASAYSAADIGTATPLSNNGELTSIPAPFSPSRLPAVDEVTAIDQIVSQVAPGLTFDMPNGIGFCLYIRNACRQAVGLLNDIDFAEGYLEEVDFCLRAREAGFRNVCAADVFVGHMGGQSFKDRRRDLVVRNLAALQRYFPQIRTETFYHIAADRLRDHRYEVQRAILKQKAFDGGSVTLVVTPRDPGGARDKHFEKPLDGRDGRQLTLYVPPRLRGGLQLNGPDGPAPFWLPLREECSDKLYELTEHLKPFTVSHIIFENGQIPDWLFHLPSSLNLPYEVLLISPAWLSMAGKCDEKGDGKLSFLQSASVVSSRSPSLLELAGAAGCERIKHIPLKRVQESAKLQPASLAGPSLAVLMASDDDVSLGRLKNLAVRSLGLGRPLRMVIFGAVKKVECLMRTGLISAVDVPVAALVPDLFALHGCTSTFLLSDKVLPGDDILMLAAQAPGPLLVSDQHCKGALAHLRRDITVLDCDIDEEELLLLVERAMMVLNV